MKKSTIKNQILNSKWFRVTCFAMLSCFTFLNSNGQSVAGYTFTEGTETYTAVGGTTSTATSDDGTETAISIGFTFKFGGVDYTTFSITTNGMIRMGGTAIVSGWSNSLGNAASLRPLIAPFWDDNHANTGVIKYEVLGSAPNRTLEVGWDAINIGGGGSTSSTNKASYKLRLYETSNNIEFIYGPTMATAGALTASVGINDNTSFLSVTPGATSTVSSTTANNSISSTTNLVGKKFTFAPPPICSSANGGTISPAAVSKCVGQTYAMSSVGASNTPGISYQWKVSSTSGSGYTPISGATTTSYTTPALTSGVYYYVMETTCANCGPCSSNSNELTLTVNSLPTVSVTPSSGTICNPGGTAVSLTADGASTYAWSPSTGLSAATGASVTSLPSSSTVYTITGTDANGCTATTSASININLGVVVNSITASPANVCPNGNSTLTANANFATPTYCQSTHTSGCSGDNIASVTLNTLYNTNSACGLSGSTPPRYIYQTGPTAPTTTLSANSTYTMTLSFGTDGNQYFGAWIDYNQNGSLETSEFLGASTNAGSSGTTSISFTVPAGANNGKTRLRIIGGNDSPLTSAQACGASSSAWGETQDYDVTLDGGIDPFTYTWSESPNTTLSSLSGNPVNANNIPSTTTYTVVASSAAGCTSTGTVTMTIAPLTCAAPTATTACANTNFTVTANTIGGGAPFTYSWNDGNGGVYPDASSITANLPAGSYTFTVSVSDACGQNCSSSVTVNVSANPTGTNSGSTTGVTYEALNYAITGYNMGDNFQWQYSTSASGPWTNLGTNSDSLSTTASSAGVFYIQCVITNAAGCSYTTNSVTTTITVAGNEPCSPVALTLGLNGPFTNNGATADIGEPVPATNGCNVQNGWCNSTLENTVWFTFVAPPTGRVVINTGAPLWDNQMALYSATNCADYTTYTQLAANDDGGDGSFAAKIAAICLVPGQTYYLQVDGYNGTVNGAFFLNFIQETAGVKLAAKAFLAGAYDASLGLMHDSLRVNGQVPTTEPYTAAPFSKPAIAEPSGETTTSTVLGVSGNNAIVDWVYLELRNPTTPASIVATRRALIQRDGDIVDVDGTSPVSFPSLSYGSYYVTVKHRNHLGVMTAGSVNLGPCDLGVVDLANSPVWVKAGEINGPRKMFGSVGALWASDANRNKNSKYNGLANDKQEVLNAVGVGTPNNVLGPVYRTEDLNMDAKVKYNNLDNDRNVIANTVGVSTPNNLVTQHTPN